MMPLLQAIAALGTTIATDAARRAATTMAALLLAGSLMLTSLLFFTLAGYRALVSALGEIQAPLVIGVAYLVTGLVALLVVQSRR